MMTLEQAQEIKHSTQWQWIQVELHERIDVCMRKLKTCKVEDVLETQLLIKGYEDLLALPQNVIDRESE